MVEPGMNPDWKRVEVPKPNAAKEIGGCLLLLLPLLWIGSCVFGGSDEPAPRPTPTTVASPAPTAASGAAAAVGSTMLEQAILDAFPAKPPKGRKAERAASNAADFIGATINAAGHLCARPVEAQQVAAGQYGIGCRKYRSGGARSNFIVDVRTGRVSKI